MSGNHRAEQETNKARAAVAGALTAGALLLAPVGVALATPGVAHAAPPGVPGGTGGTGGTGGGPTVHKNIIRLPGLKIEIKHVQGQPPKIKVVPFPGLHPRPATQR